MHGVIERRRQYLQLMRQFTFEHGYFTVTDIQSAANVPRSTAQDWINRLIGEGCVAKKESKSGRQPARFIAISAMPSSTCRRMFTTVDGDYVEIFHDCMSGACAAFCGHHHLLAGGMITSVQRDGTLLREYARLGQAEVSIGLHPASAVGVVGVGRSGDSIIQQIRSIGGPAYSLTEMLSQASGVTRVEIRRDGDLVEGMIWTKALEHIVIGIDDTDSREGGATFALALALLQRLGTLPGIFAIGHHVAMLYPDIGEKTAGNSCSFIDVAVESPEVPELQEKVYRFVADEALSPEWGVAMKRGFLIPAGLRNYGRRVREERVLLSDAEKEAADHCVSLHGGRGMIGALGAVALSGLPNNVLLNPEAPVPL